MNEQQLDDLIERLIEIRDAMDPDPDLEEGGDHEPYLAGSDSDLEDDPARWGVGDRSGLIEQGGSLYGVAT